MKKKLKYRYKQNSELSFKKKKKKTCNKNLGSSLLKTKILGSYPLVQLLKQCSVCKGFAPESANCTRAINKRYHYANLSNKNFIKGGNTYNFGR